VYARPLKHQNERFNLVLPAMLLPLSSPDLTDSYVRISVSFTVNIRCIGSVHIVYCISLALFHVRTLGLVPCPSQIWLSHRYMCIRLGCSIDGIVNDLLFLSPFHIIRCKGARLQLLDEDTFRMFILRSLGSFFIYLLHAFMLD
jgi:hypothetical protein